MYISGNSYNRIGELSAEIPWISRTSDTSAKGSHINIPLKTAKESFCTGLNMYVKLYNYYNLLSYYLGIGF